MRFQRRQKRERYRKRDDVKKNPNEENDGEEKFVVPFCVVEFIRPSPGPFHHPNTEGKDGSDDGKDEKSVESIRVGGDVEFSPGFKRKVSANLEEGLKICIQGQFFMLKKTR